MMGAGQSFWMGTYDAVLEKARSYNLKLLDASHARYVVNGVGCIALRRYAEHGLSVISEQVCVLLQDSTNHSR